MEKQENYINGYHLFPNVLRTLCIKILDGKLKVVDIAQHSGVSRSSVVRVKIKLEQAKISSQKQLAQLSNSELIKLLYEDQKKPTTPKEDGSKYKPDIEWLVEQMIERKLNFIQAYQLYKDNAQAHNKSPYSKSYICHKLSTRLKEIKKNEPDYYFIQSFPYGMYAQIDFSGAQYKVLTHNGEINCWLLVVCWPASYYVFAQFVSSQSTSESCRVLNEAFKMCGYKVPSIIVVDNAKCFVTKHSGAEAIINRNFAEHLQEYGVCVEATPVRHPQAKSSVEYSVNLTQKLLEGKRFLFNTHKKTLSEHNQVLQALINQGINQAPFRKSTVKTREYLFKNYELPLCLDIKTIIPYQGDVNTIRVPRSYHISLFNHQYSVPYEYIGKQVDVYFSSDVVWVKFEGKEIARHMRNDGDGITTIQEHMPKEHQSITTNNKIYNTTDDVLSISKGIDDGVHFFCLNKIKHDTSHGYSVRNTIRSCVAVINYYKRAPLKRLFSEACKSICNYPPNMWNSYEVEKLFNEICKESNYQEQNLPHQTELFRVNDDEACLRGGESDDKNDTSSDNAESKDKDDAVLDNDNKTKQQNTSTSPNNNTQQDNNKKH